MWIHRWIPLILLILHDIPLSHPTQGSHPSKQKKKKKEKSRIAKNN
ncbi:hypothetical protein GLYMA_17G060450v4 [Glycine max]|nr:hypothetical protein GLYMA_17G060450v4 [Glycine max]KAH1117045.1 hypothetical protein GYH30_046408 [Glycine max]